tara:strand:- start:11204 stop:11473 length:270 start_codon:yes stop_codon:yes gene_type:complete
MKIKLTVLAILAALILITMLSGCKVREKTGKETVKYTQGLNSWESSQANWMKNEIEQAKAVSKAQKEQDQKEKELAKHHAKIERIKNNL